MAPPKRIHIVGISPRSGTTLLAECMVACFDIDGFESHEAAVTRLRAGRRIYLTKRPADLFSLKPRLRLDPHFHAICLMRDPRDVVVSRHRKDPDRYWAPLRLWKQRLPVLRELMAHERVQVVKYEDLVAIPDAIQARLQQALPFLVRTHAFSAFADIARPSSESVKALGGVRGFDSESIGNWRRPEHLSRLAGQLAMHGPITDELIELGYERDGAWLSALDGVTPDLTRSHLPERRRRSLIRRLRRSGLALPWISAAFVAATRTIGLRIS